jgi:hypothetical protein
MLLILPAIVPANAARSLLDDIGTPRTVTPPTLSSYCYRLRVQLLMTGMISILDIKILDIQRSFA